MSEFDENPRINLEIASAESSNEEFLAVPPEFDRNAILREGAAFFKEAEIREHTQPTALEVDRELTLDLKAEIVRQARATVERIANVDHLSDAIKADIQRLLENYSEIAGEGSAALFSEIYYEAFEEAVALRAETEEIYRQAAELVTEQADKGAFDSAVAALQGRLGLDGTPLIDKFQSAYKREQELYQMLIDRAGALGLSDQSRESPSRSKISLDIRSELAALSQDPGYRALVRRQEVKIRISKLLRGETERSLAHDSARSGEGFFIPGAQGGGGHVVVRKLKRLIGTSLLPLIIGFFLVVKALIRALMTWLRSFIDKGGSEGDKS